MTPRWLWVACLASTLVCTAGWAGVLMPALRHSSTDHCEADNQRTATEQDRQLQFAQRAAEVLHASGAEAAIVSRAGLDIQWLRQRYSHAGLVTRTPPDNRWQVRQLYFDCQARHPRLFDQGLAGFVMGTERTDTGFLSLLLLPEDPATRRLLAVATDDRAAAALIGPSYSANAFAFSVLHQNCNQWLAELLGWAWSTALPASLAEQALPRREEAQQALRQLDYRPEALQIQPAWLLGWLRGLPFLHLDDHPADDVALGRLQVSMPASIERWVQNQLPGTQRVELCHNRQQIVIRRNGPPLPDDCSAAPGDTLLPLDR